MVKTLRIGILASGTGSNFEAIADALRARSIAAEVAVLICNREAAPVIDKARARGVPAEILSHKDYRDRTAFDAALADTLESYQADLVALAGFDRLVTSALLGRFPDRVINIHPALLPSFPGVDAQKQALEHGVKIAGATVHFVDEKVDHGPIIAQVAVPAAATDDVETLRARIIEREHELYPLVIELFAKGRIHLSGRTVRIDGVAVAAGALFNPPLARG